MNKSIMITGANNGIGKEAARQLALKPETEKIYLACRNPEKAKKAQIQLESSTGRAIFEIIIMDTSKPESVKNAVKLIKEPIDALIMNAGGIGGKEPSNLTKDGVTQVFASNVLGHAVLLEELIKASKLKKVALYAGSEAARGIDKMKIAKPEMKEYTAEEFDRVFNGSFFGSDFDPMEAYAYTKYIASLWIAAEARKHPELKLITVSPGGTRGTGAMDDVPLGMKLFYKYFAMPIMLPLMGMAHSLEKGTKRFVDAIADENLKSGVFYGSKQTTITGPLVEQTAMNPSLANIAHQDAAYLAINRYLN